MNSLITVIGFTFKNKVKSKAFLVTSLIIAVLLSILINVPYLIQLFSSDEPKKMGMFEDSSEVSVMLHRYLDQQEVKDFDLIFFTPEETTSQNDSLIRQEIANGNIDGFIELQDHLEGGSFPKVVFKSERSLDFSINSALRNALSNIKTELAIQNLDISDEQLARLFEPITIENFQISISEPGDTSESRERADKSESQMAVAFGLVYVLIVLFFMGTMISGQLIATEITAEKSTRVMEILVTSVAPLKQMFGKIIGMFLLGISQIILFGLVFIINISFPHNKEMMDGFNINLADIELTLFIYFIAFYLLGYFLYATIFAAIGSLVSRTEDLGQAIMPVTFLTLAVFYVGIFGINAPSSTFMTVMSYIPFFTPITMFIRIGMADPAIWEIALSFVILIATILGMGWLSAKIYRTGVLMYGKRPSIKEIRKAMKAFRV